MAGTPRPTVDPVLADLEDRGYVISRHEGTPPAVATGGTAPDAYRPVPMPLVPEHHLRENAHLANAWGVAAVERDTVSHHIG